MDDLNASKVVRLEEDLRKANALAAELRYNVERLERENRLLSVMQENAEKLRLFDESEKKLQYLYYEFLLQYCPSPIFIFDEDLRCVTCTKTSLALTKFEDIMELKMLSMHSVFGGVIEPLWVELLHEKCQSVVQGGSCIQIKERITFLDGRFIYAQIDLEPIVDSTGAKRGVIVAMNNITEITEMKMKAEELSLSKSAFLANMSHEIRTPMNAIKGLSELLLQSELNEVQRAYLRNVVSSSQSLLGIINDILDYSKIDANRMETVEVEYRLGSLINDVSRMIYMRGRDKFLSMEVEIDPTLPDILYGDEGRIKQVLLNLLSNAVKYTREGGFAFRVSGKQAANAGTVELYFEVQDTGLGIKEEDQGSLFEAFARADLRKNRSILGTGLGLAISKRLAEAMQGDITVQSEYGKGSTFTFSLVQQVVQSRPLAHVTNPEQYQAVILAQGERAEKLTTLLTQLGITSQSYHEGINFAESTKSVLCISFDDVPKELTFIPHGLEHKIFCVADMEHAGAERESDVHTLLEPVLITELAEAICPDAAAYAMQDVGEEEKPNFEAHVLVVDDNEINLMVAGEMLRSIGVEVEEVISGEDAILLCSKEKFDLIFMDHMMPGMDGVETTTALRNSDGYNRYTPVIALTANVVGGMKEFFMERGMDDFVSKPIELTELVRVLRKYCKSKDF